MKVFGIFLVVLGHFTPNYNLNFTTQYLYQFHMPLFFIISGYLAKDYKSTVKIILKKNCRRLLIPYFLLVFLGWGFEWLLIGNECNWMGYISSFKKTFIGIPSGCVDSMWFIYVLFFIKVIELAWENVRKKYNLSNLPMIMLMALFVIIIQVYPNLYLPRPLNWILAAYFFFFCGKIIKSKDAILLKINIVVKFVLGIALLAVPLIGMRYNGFVDLYFWSFGNYIIAYYVVGILSSVGLFFLFSCILNKENKVIRTLSDGTIMIVALHKLILYFLWSYDSPLLVRIGICVLVVMFFYFPIYLSSRYFPLLIGKTNKV